jgi:hypothetical protein
VTGPGRRCILLLADGARPDVLAELVQKGDLPHLTRHLLEPGAAREAVTVFPSTTGPAHLPFLTGLFPGTCEIPGIRWFDPVSYEENRFSLSRFRSYVGPGSYLLSRDLRRDVRTLFHYIPDHANIFGNCTAGLRFHRNLSRFARLRLNLFAFVTTTYGPTDLECARLLRESAQRRFVFAVLPGVDGESHKAGIRSPGTLAAYRRLDLAVGALAARLGGRLEEEVLLWLVSDHGLTDTFRHFDLEAFLAGRGGPVLAYPRLTGALGGARSACMVSGNAMAHVHLRGEAGWGDERRARALGLELCDQPGIDVVAWREAGAIHAASRRGEARIALRGRVLEYEPLGGDPFGYQPLPRQLDVQEALAATAATAYPDALVQLAQLFRSRRTGDLVVTASSGWDLRARFERPPHRASHGALCREHMVVPLWANRRLPGGPLRTADVFAATLSWMQIPLTQGIDGVAFRID